MLACKHIKARETSWNQGVRRVTRADLDLCFRNRRQFEAKYGQNSVDTYHKKRIRFAMELGEAIASRSVPKLEKALVRMWGSRIGKGSVPLYREQPLRLLADEFNPSLASTSLCVWWSSVAHRLVWGVRCKTIEEALFVLALSAVGDIGAIGKCKRCKELFFRVRPNKKYCGDGCQAADGMRRKRIRDKRIQERRQSRRSASGHHKGTR
jgi:hypothetical protein